MKKRVRVHPKLYLALIAGMLVFFGLSCAFSLYKITELNYHSEDLRRRKEELEVQVGRLNEELMYVRSDEYIVRVARDKLKMLMPGEIRYTNESPERQ